MKLERPKLERPKLERVQLDKPARLARPAKGMVHPAFDSLFNPAIPNPLDGVEYPGTLEGDAKAEVSAALAAILAERKLKRDAYRLMADTEYWVCLCFQSRAQKEEFLQKMGWLPLGDKYLDGLKVAEMAGLGIEPVDLPAPKGTTRTPKLLRTEVKK